MKNKNREVQNQRAECAEENKKTRHKPKPLKKKKPTTKQNMTKKACHTNVPNSAKQSFKTEGA